MTRSQSTPESSQIIWLEGRVKQLEALHDAITAERDKLKAALEYYADNSHDVFPSVAIEALKESACPI